MRFMYIEAGQIVTTHGVRGEVKVLTYLDSPEMLCEFDRCRVNGKEYKIQSCRVQKTCNLVKLQGIDTMEDAQRLHGVSLEIYREDVDPEVIFSGELLGMEVFCAEKCIGQMTDVLDYPGNQVYVVGKQEYMIPAVKEFILSTDLEANRMQVKLIEGMKQDEN